MAESPYQTRDILLLSLALTVGMAAVVGGALGFEHIGGYIPCMLCLMQRTPYYVGIPLGILAVLSILFRMPAWTTRALLLAVAALMLYGGGLGVYHAGVEWHFWPGPTSCATAAQGVTTDAGNLLGDINAKKPPSCDAAALRILGLSFAGWNAIASLVLAAIAIRAARARA
jgi:Disulfide bond formation protein DsbB